MRSGKARGRDARYSARGGVQGVATRSERTVLGQSRHARGACEVRGSAGSGFAQRLELLHKSKLPRQRGQMRRAPAARGAFALSAEEVSICGVILTFARTHFQQNP